MKRFKVKRKSERWVSNNRVLLGSSKKDPGRNPNFDTEETKLLISLWGDPVLQKTLITTHRKHTVIAKLAEKMTEYGYSRSPEEINTRIKNLKCFYNRLKKDIEAGAINVATWKHYPAMDEIMTRSIFSVRPNEIPKPSLKYQLEIEQNEEVERNKLREAITNAGKSSFLSAQSSEENISYSSNSSEADMIEESIECIPCDHNMECIENDETLVKIKEEDCFDPYNEDIEEVPLIIPKEERFDDDIPIEMLSKDIKKTSENLTPRLSEYIQISNNNSNSIALSSNCRTLVNGNRNGSLPTTPSPGVTQSILLANQTNSVPTTGKISLVPTNFLLQQNTAQPQQIQIRQQPQQRIICTQSNSHANNAIVTSAGAGRMKVLLVNAFQNGKTNIASPKEASFINPNLITTANIHKTNSSDAAFSKAPAESSKQSKTEEIPTSKVPGLDLLFNKLIAMHNENNEIQRQRLEIEKERLEFEKATAEKLLTALSSLNQVQTRKYVNVADTTDKRTSSEQHMNEKGHQPDFIDDLNTFPLLIPKIERQD